MFEAFIEMFQIVDFGYSKLL